MFGVIITLFLITFASADDEYKTVILEEGSVTGEKYWNGDFYEFYGVPYASVPTGRDRFKGPLAPKKWNGTLYAKNKNIACPQTAYSDDDDEEIMLYGEEDCLTMNLLVPVIADEENLVPVLVYIHSGAYAIGHGNMAKYNFLARHDILVVSFNFRLGAIGFVCLGNEEIPGNAGMKDQVAALRWINNNIKKFGGDPNHVTVAGYSVGAAMAELLALSKSTYGLMHKIILESGSALSPFAINRDPVHTAKNIATAIGFNGTDDIKELTEFYLNTPIKNLAAKSLNFFLPNSTFGFAPCIENSFGNKDAFITESPLDILVRGLNNKISVLTGYSNMEGLSRTSKFDSWSEMMNKKFSDFLPADLIFSNQRAQDNVSSKIKNQYFKGEEVTHDTLQNYVAYFSDSMFKYAILKSANIHASTSKRPVYFYEFSYFGELNMKHQYMDKIQGASHRDQTAYLLDFYGWTSDHRDMDTRDRMTIMWTDFVKYENPTEYENIIMKYKWKPYSSEMRNYLDISVEPTMKQDLLKNSYNFWDNIYKEFYWNPKAVTIFYIAP